MSLKHKLNRMRGHLGMDSLKEKAAAVVEDHSSLIEPIAEAALDIPFADVWEGLQAKPYVLDDEYIMVREVRYPLSHQHGTYRFADLYDVIAGWESMGSSHPLSSNRQTAEDLLFFDTETTGLHGGAGNQIFLLGYSRIEGDSVVVRQHFLSAPHAEVPLYHSFLSDAKDLTHLVTYNGKAFDWPQVKTRHTLIRDMVPKLPAFGHYDLLHGARRLWKHELPSCRLSIVEQQKLGITRENDVPGSMAPLLYYDYVQQRNPEIIRGVLHHNEGDVLSLITLYIHISKLLLAYRHDTVSHGERYEIARWYEAVGEYALAMECYQVVAESRHEWSDKALIALGHQYKKLKDWRQALSVWEQMIERVAATPLHVPEEVYVEVAKIYEHQVKDYEKALYYTQKAFDVWKKKVSLMRSKPKAEQTAYEKRIERLEKKIGAVGRLV